MRVFLLILTVTYIPLIGFAHEPTQPQNNQEEQSFNSNTDQTTSPLEKINELERKTSKKFKELEQTYWHKKMKSEINGAIRDVKAIITYKYIKNNKVKKKRVKMVIESFAQRSNQLLSQHDAHQNRQKKALSQDDESSHSSRFSSKPLLSQMQREFIKECYEVTEKALWVIHSKMPTR